MSQQITEAQADGREPPRFVYWTGAIVGLLYIQILRGSSRLWNVFVGGIVGASSAFVAYYVYYAFRPDGQKVPTLTFCFLGTLFYVICDSGFGIAVQLLGASLPWPIVFLWPVLIGWIVGLHAVSSLRPPIRSVLLVSVLNFCARVVLIAVFVAGEWVRLPADTGFLEMLISALMLVPFAAGGGILSRLSPAYQSIRH